MSLSRVPDGPQPGGKEYPAVDTGRDGYVPHVFGAGAFGSVDAHDGIGDRHLALGDGIPFADVNRRPLIVNFKLDPCIAP